MGHLPAMGQDDLDTHTGPSQQRAGISRRRAVELASHWCSGSVHALLVQPPLLALTELQLLRLLPQGSQSKVCIYPNDLHA